MEETKNIKKTQNKKEKRGKHREKATLGDIVFRVLIVVVIFFIALISYAFYIQGISNTGGLNQSTSRRIAKIN